MVSACAHRCCKKGKRAPARIVPIPVLSLLDATFASAPLRAGDASLLEGRLPIGAVIGLADCF